MAHQSCRWALLMRILLTVSFIQMSCVADHHHFPESYPNGDPTTRIKGCNRRISIKSHYAMYIFSVPRRCQCTLESPEISHVKVGTFDSYCHFSLCEPERYCDCTHVSLPIVLPVPLCQGFGLFVHTNFDCGSSDRVLGATEYNLTVSCMINGPADVMTNTEMSHVTTPNTTSTVTETATRGVFYRNLAIGLGLVALVIVIILVVLISVWCKRRNGAKRLSMATHTQPGVTNPNYEMAGPPTAYQNVTGVPNAKVKKDLDNRITGALNNETGPAEPRGVNGKTSVPRPTDNYATVIPRDPIDTEIVDNPDYNRIEDEEHDIGNNVNNDVILVDNVNYSERHDPVDVSTETTMIDNEDYIPTGQSDKDAVSEDITVLVDNQDYTKMEDDQRSDDK